MSNKSGGSRNIDNPNAGPSMASTGNEEDQRDSNLDQRTPSQCQLFDLIEAGDQEGFLQYYEHFTERHREVDWAKKKDKHGHDMASHAVIHGQLEMLETILPRIKNGREALLHAIKANRLDMVRIIYAQVDQRQEFVDPPPSKNQKNIDKKFDDCEFGDHMTPFLLAAMNGHLEIMQYLYKNNRIRDDDYESKNRHKHPHIFKLHGPNCVCRSCKTQGRELDRTRRRLDTMKARANPAFLFFLSSKRGIDPVYQSFELHQEIIDCSRKEMEFENEYKEIAKGLHSFPVELLDLCKDRDEVETFLSAKSSGPVPPKTAYPQLAVAINHFHREFVAHPNVQHVVGSLFHGDVVNEYNTVGNIISNYIATAFCVFLWPVAQIFYLINSWCCDCCSDCCCECWEGFGKRISSPRMKSWSRFASHLTLCIILFVLNFQKVPFADKSPVTLSLAGFVLCYSVALWLSLFNRVFINPRGFFKSGWNWWEALTQAVFTVQAVLASYLIYLMLFSDNKPKIRTEMDQSDPLVVEELARGILSVMVTLQLLRWVIFSPDFGPLQTGFYRMAVQQWTYALLIPAIIFAFSYSTDITVRNFEANIMYDPYDLKKKEQSIELHYKQRLMINFFSDGIGPDEAILLDVPKQSDNETKLEGEDRRPFHVNQMFMYAFAFVWNVIIISFLKETLVGQFSAAGPAIFEAKDTEWKFDRAKEMLYQAMDGTFAPPFNLCLKRKVVVRFCRFICCKCVEQKEAHCVCSCDEGCCWIKDVESPKENNQQEPGGNQDNNGAKKTYGELMTDLCLRWFNTKMDYTKEKPTQGDMQEVQNSLKEFKDLAGKSIKTRNDRNAKDKKQMDERNAENQALQKKLEEAKRKLEEANNKLAKTKSKHEEEIKKLKESNTLNLVNPSETPRSQSLEPNQGTSTSEQNRSPPPTQNQ